jgi:hypothetical protein
LINHSELKVARVFAFTSGLIGTEETRLSINAVGPDEACVVWSLASFRIQVVLLQLALQKHNVASVEAP